MWAAITPNLDSFANFVARVGMNRAPLGGWIRHGICTAWVPGSIEYRIWEIETMSLTPSGIRLGTAGRWRDN